MQTEKPSPKPIRSLDTALQRCQALGMRLSRQRRFILELLWNSEEHLSAREIYDRLNQEGKEIGHTSVYQNLDALSEQGIIECLERSDRRLYGHISDSHSHVNCLETGRILDIRVTLPAELIQQVEAQTGLYIQDYRIDFYGSPDKPLKEADLESSLEAAPTIALAHGNPSTAPHLPVEEFS